MYDPSTIFRTALLLVTVVATSGCTSLGLQTPVIERYLACPHDSVWKEALDTLQAYPMLQKDKEDGLIETDWREQAASQHTYGLLGRSGLTNKERTRVTFSMKTIGEGAVFVRFTEQRQYWGFTGGARIYQWTPIEPSQNFLNGLMNQLTAQLDKEGCIVES